MCGMDWGERARLGTRKRATLNPHSALDPEFCIRELGEQPMENHSSRERENKNKSSYFFNFSPFPSPVKIAVPAYFRGSRDWDELEESSRKGAVTFAVANANNGPGKYVNFSSSTLSEFFFAHALFFAFSLKKKKNALFASGAFRFARARRSKCWATSGRGPVFTDRM